MSGGHRPPAAGSRRLQPALGAPDAPDHGGRDVRPTNLHNLRMSHWIMSNFFCQGIGSIGVSPVPAQAKACGYQKILWRESVLLLTLTAHSNKSSGRKITSRSRATPCWRQTCSWISPIRAFTWAAVARPWLRMKLACFRETWASPTRRPLSPDWSMRKPAPGVPGGFLKTLPQLR